MKRGRFGDAHDERRINTPSREREGRRNFRSSERPPQPRRSHHNNTTNDEFILDEDLLLCTTFEAWKRSHPILAYESTEAYVARYSTMVKEWATLRITKFVERHWFESWFLERYDPERALVHVQQRRSLVHQRWNEFSPSSLVDLSSQHVVQSDLGAEPSSRCVFLPCIPPFVPRVELESALKRTMGNDAQLFMSEVNRSARRKDLARRGTVCLLNEACVQEALALEKLTLSLCRDDDGVVLECPNDKEVRNLDVVVPILPSKSLPNRVLPFASAERMQQDETQAKACARQLDRLYELEKGIEFILAQETQLSPLDVIVQYLRRVHLYCYFSGALCRDVGELMHKAATPFVRNLHPATSNTEDNRKFYETVDAMAERILSDKFVQDFQAEEQRLQTMVSQRAEGMHKAESEFFKANIVLLPKGNDTVHYHCATHNKTFETEAFLKKHLVNHHPRDLRMCQRRSLLPLLHDMFQNDDDRALPRLPWFVEDCLRNEFVPPAAPSTAFRGGDAEAVMPSSSSTTTATAITLERKYRDPDVTQPTTVRLLQANTKVKLQYRSRMNYGESL